MNAHKVADDLQECIDDGSTDLVCVQEAAILIRQQADELNRVVPQLVKANGLIENLRLRMAELQDFAIWMTGCGYDFTQHEYFNKCRDKLLVGIESPQTKPLSDEEIEAISRLNNPLGNVGGKPIRKAWD